jgi:hypothetical protein
MQQRAARTRLLCSRNRHSLRDALKHGTPDGRVAATFDGLSPVENVEHALAAVQRLAHPD